MCFYELTQQTTKGLVSVVYIWGFCPKLLWVTCSSSLLYFFLYLFWCGSCLGLTLVSFSITISTLSTRHGKLGGSDQVWVGSIGSRVKTGHGSKRVIFKRVIQVAGQTGRGLSRVASRVELTCIFQIFFFFFWSRCNLPIVYEFLNYN